MQVMAPEPKGIRFTAGHDTWEIWQHSHPLPLRFIRVSPAVTMCVHIAWDSLGVEDDTHTPKRHRDL
jgi:hypothetical protein